MQQPKQRHNKGTVAIIVSNKRLQLQFNYAGKRHYISLGLSDTVVNHKSSRQINSDSRSLVQDEDKWLSLGTPTRKIY